MSSPLDRNTIIDYYMGWAQVRARRHYRYFEYCLGLPGLLLVISPFCGRLVVDPWHSLRPPARSPGRWRERGEKSLGGDAKKERNGGERDLEMSERRDSREGLELANAIAMVGMQGGIVVIKKKFGFAQKYFSWCCFCFSLNFVKHPILSCGY